MANSLDWHDGHYGKGFKFTHVLVIIYCIDLECRPDGLLF